MQLIAHSVGVDIAADTFDVCLENVHSDRTTCVVATRNKFNNNRTGFKQLVKWIARKAPEQSLVHVTMEATGRYHESLAYFVFEAGYRLSIVLP